MPEVKDGMSSRPANNFSMLAAINVNAHTEKKNNLTYLSWAWAVDQLLRADPMASWEYGEPSMFGPTMMVFCTVTAFGKPMTMQLPVMDHRNKAIPEPDAFQVNTAMQRCLVKAIALHGLGLYIYAGEDLPDGADQPKSDIKPDLSGQPKGAVAAALDGVDMRAADKEYFTELAERITKSATPKIAVDLWNLENLDNDQKTYLWSLLDSKTRSGIKAEQGLRKGAA